MHCHTVTPRHASEPDAPSRTVGYGLEVMDPRTKRYTPFLAPRVFPSMTDAIAYALSLNLDHRVEVRATAVKLRVVA